MQMANIDQTTINDVGIPGIVLMENAAIATLREIQKRVGSLYKVRINIFCGKGNNGGDGFALARHLYNLDAEPTVFLAGNKNAVQGDAKINLDAYIGTGGRLKEITESKHLKNFRLKFMHSAVVVDALLGTGAKSVPAGIYAELVGIMNSHGKLKVAIDIPTGIIADKGAIEGECFKADVTITFGAPKLAHYTYPAKKAVGELVIADISIPKSVIENSVSIAYTIDRSDAKKMFPARDDSAHKGNFGHLLVIAGSRGMGGACALACESALRTGSGLVTAAIASSLLPSFETGVKETMAIALLETSSGSIDISALGVLKNVTKKKSAILLGPGLSTDKSTVELVKQFIPEIELPMVIDADGLNALDGNTDLITQRNGSTIITPHPGEMSRLTGRTVKDIQSDRIDSARRLSDKTGAVVLLKGAGTVVAAPGESPAYINNTGTAALATAGSGDVLAGIIGGLLAQGVEPASAAILGAFIHGELASAYEAEHGNGRSMIAGDLIGLLPKVIGELLSAG